MKPSTTVSAEEALSPERVEWSYDRWAAVYGVWAAITESRAHQLAFEAAEPAAGQSVLEVAVGTGELFAWLAGTTGLSRCIGTDLSGGMLRRARHRLKSAGRPGALCRSDARHLPFASATFDLVVNSYMLDLLSEADIRAVLAEFHRTLKDGAKLVLLYMAEQNPIVNRLWMWLFRHAPTLVGGCRPVAVRTLLRDDAWHIEKQERISQNGFRSELIVARALTMGEGTK
ncbi:MAG TPA: methyltransferase domain-containing protein [Terriglobia bacterium]|nr:methyltransferase domain-containing protein [Terriglobia bacterium]